MTGLWHRKPKLDRWEDYFEPGETLLWQGQPEPGLKAPWAAFFSSVFGIPFFLAGLKILSDGLSGFSEANGGAALGHGLLLTAFSIPFIGVGSTLCFGSWIAALYGDRYTQYALTNKRAYVAHSFPTHKLATYVIGPDDVVTLTQGKFDTVQFKTIQERDSDGDKKTSKIGFNFIADGSKVYKLIREIQSEAK